ncbi:MAG: hypothetical protein IKK04_04505 [Bacteroidales bacterium]|nr:hypothetical protein [Bacteroidales bacterium]
MNHPSEPLDARPRTMKEICAYYGVSYRTMRKLMARAGLAHLLGRRGRGMYYFQISELTQIEAAFSHPELDFGN